MSILTTAVALGLCQETQNEEIAAEQMAVTIRALQTQALEAQREVAAIQARECARLDARLADIRRRVRLGLTQ